MKMTVNINLGGYAFNVDEDAYDRLRQYLKTLEKEFSGESSAAEIMADIEGRIAELFKMRLTTIQTGDQHEGCRRGHGYPWCT